MTSVAQENTLTHQTKLETRIAKCENDIAGMLESEEIVPATMARDAAHFLWWLVYEQQQPQYGIQVDGVTYIYNTYPKLMERYEFKFNVETVRKKIIRPLEEVGIINSCKPRVHFSYHEKAYRVNLDVACDFMAMYYEWYQSRKFASKPKRDPEPNKQCSESTRINSTLDPTESGQQTDSLNTTNRHNKQTRERTVQTKRLNNHSDNNNQAQPGCTQVSQQVHEISNHYQAEPDLSTNSEKANYSAPKQCPETPINGDLESAEERELFTQDIYAMLKNQASVELNNAEAYTNSLIGRLDRGGDYRSLATLEKWRNGEPFEVIFPQFATTQTAASPSEPVSEVKHHNSHSPSSSRKSASKQDTLREWHIKPEDEELLNFGYQVGEIYPEFVQWCAPRLKYHPDLTDYVAKSHALKKLKLEPQLALELWRDFKRLLVREVEDKQHAEARGLPYYTPNWMRIPQDIPVDEARQASLELNELRMKEQKAIEATEAQIQQELEQANQHARLQSSHDTEAGPTQSSETEQLQSEPNQQQQESSETNQSELEESQQQQELGPIESVKNAIALMKKRSDHPMTKGIVQNIINGAKANASESELEEIQRLEDQAFEF